MTLDQNSSATLQISTHSGHPLSAGGGGGEPPTRGWGLQFSHKNKLKSDIFNDKKMFISKKIFSVITKNSNWQVLPKNLVNFKR